MVQAFPYDEFTSYLITRNTSERRYYLRPSQELLEAILYCLADAQAQHPVQIHAFCAMSNHIHVVLTDHDGTAPLFVQAMNQNIARYVNCSLRRFGAMWEGGARPNYCVLPESGDILDKVVYTLTNPVKAGLIPQHHLWPGAISSIAQISKGRITTKRPKKFFSKTDDPVLLTRDLILTPVPGAEVMGHEDYGRYLAQRVAEVEVAIATEREAKGLRWLGRKACLKINPFDAPTTPWKRFTRNPKVSSKHEEARNAWIARLKRFIVPYDGAKKEFRAGNRDTPFPLGTFAMRVFWGVCIDPHL
ncbi:transposase [Myxococcota bacterium]|jgi:REP element-mobilizing transposase RayT|nr:transposase [Myxococcota bacterium]MBU1411038.1 transposase [Myxococcota bacterium]MBU1512323.1 transposase [Myxococcota bacterium]